MVDSRWGVPFVLENDARLAVIGEWLYGAAKGTGNVVMMTLGTGIGTGVILDSKPLVGHHHQAGSLGGHMVVDYRGRRCSCGNIGCVEAMASSFSCRILFGLTNVYRQILRLRHPIWILNNCSV